MLNMVKVSCFDMAAREVSKQIQAKWFHDTVYYVSLSSVCKMVRKVHTTYTEGKHRQKQGRFNSEAYGQFVKLYLNRKKLFDVYPHQPGSSVVRKSGEVCG